MYMLSNICACMYYAYLAINKNSSYVIVQDIATVHSYSIMLVIIL